MKKKKLLTSIAVIMAMVITAATSSAGTITYAPITSDADSGISSDNIYTHAIDFGGWETAETVNGVVFARGTGTDINGGNFPPIDGTSQTVGTGSITSPSTNNGWASIVNADGDIKNLLADFVSGTPAEGYVTVNLTGLTPENTYKFRLYNHQWTNNVGTREMQIGFVTDGVGTDMSAAADTAIFSEDDATQPDPSLDVFNRVYALEYTYTLPADVSTLKVIIEPTGSDNYHMYAMTNEVVPEPATLALLGLGGLGLLRRRIK